MLTGESDGHMSTVCDGEEKRRSDDEQFWRMHMPWLETQGYIPVQAVGGTSWEKQPTRKDLFQSSHRTLRVLRTMDNRHFTLHLTSCHSASNLCEAEGTTWDVCYPREGHSSTSNHSIPVHEVLDVPCDEDRLKRILRVVPTYGDALDPGFETIGEAVDFLHQMFESLQFMHINRVAHRDVCTENMVSDLEELNHTSGGSSDTRNCFSRTQTPPRYYLTSFLHSRHYPVSYFPIRENAFVGRDTTAPEHAPNCIATLCNPLETDVYHMGNIIRENFYIKKRGFNFLQVLMLDMTQPNMAKRPTMDAVVSRFDAMVAKLPESKLRSRVVDRKEFLLAQPIRYAKHWFRHREFKRQGLHAIPTPWL